MRKEDVKEFAKACYNCAFPEVGMGTKTYSELADDFCQKHIGPTVREAFSAVFAPVPDGATCHIGSWFGASEPLTKMEAIYLVPGGWPTSLAVRQGWANHKTYEFPFGPDISDRPASSFIGFFGDAFDNYVKEQLEKERN